MDTHIQDKRDKGEREKKGEWKTLSYLALEQECLGITPGFLFILT